MSNPDFITVLQILAALPITYLISKMVLFIANKTGFVSHPNPIVFTHKFPVAYGGGAGIGFSIIVFLFIHALLNDLSIIFILVLLPVLIAGFLDDLFGFNPFKKFLLQIISAFPFLLYYLNLSVPYFIIFLLFILVEQNAWNLVDIMDGLIAGISVIVFFSAGIILYPFDDFSFYSYLSFLTAVSVLGFGFLNKYPAKIFLGETGSLLLGSLFAFIVIIISIEDLHTAVLLALLGIIPLFELIFLIIVRTEKGIPFYKGSPDHFALRLLQKGMSVRKINFYVLITCFCNAMLIVLASLLRYNGLILFLYTILIFISGIIAYVYFKSLPVREINT